MHRESSARVNISNRFDYSFLYKGGSEASVTIHGMSGTEGQEPAGSDPIDLQLSRGAAGIGRVPTVEQAAPQASTTPMTRFIDTKSLLQVTPHHGDKGSFLVWKWSFLIAVRAISKPLYEGFKKIEDNMSQDSENRDCPKRIWSFQIRPTHCWRYFAKMKRVLT